MRILFVDNDSERINLFSEVVGTEHEVDTCMDAEDGINAVHSVKYDCIVLDSELGTEPAIKDPYSDPVGYGVIHAIKESDNSNTATIVHNTDTGSYSQLKRILPNIVYIPFNELSLNLIESMPKIMNLQ